MSGEANIALISGMVRYGTLKREALAPDVLTRLEAFEAGELETETDEDQPGLFEGFDND